MWFKRRKKSEQDHALSESLRSLQSLLSETGRHEPDLDPRHSPSEETGAGGSDRHRPAAGPTLAVNSRNGARPDKEHRDAPAGQPEAPGGSGNRWRDLNLSFDAEPVVPRTRRKENVDLDDSEPVLESVSDEGSAETVHHSEPDVVTYDSGTAPVPASRRGDAPGQDPAQSELDAGFEFPADLDDDMLVLDLQEPESDAGIEARVPGAGDGSEADEPEPGEPGTVEEEAVSQDTGTAAPDDDRDEDQLRLELESSPASEADIPVLTNAVYVPDPPPKKQAPPGPPESPHEERIARCIGSLRVRLQLMGLDNLSAEQETELHDTLVELLDELEHD